MSFHRPTRLQLAVHEAGHDYAYAALVQNGIPVEMGLGVDADGGHHGCRSNRSTTALMLKKAQ